MTRMRLLTPRKNLRRLSIVLKLQKIISLLLYNLKKMMYIFNLRSSNRFRSLLNATFSGNPRTLGLGQMMK
jgi:hypothetical protein